MLTRRHFTFAASGALVSVAFPSPTLAAADPTLPVLTTWYRLMLELVRHTPTQSPPVASRAMAYFGVAAYESLASCDPTMRSLAGQLNGLAQTPGRPADPGLSAAVTLHATLAETIAHFFANTGPTGQRAMTAMTRKLGAMSADGLQPEIVAASSAHGRAIARHIIGWAQTDGGEIVSNMGFPASYTPSEGPEHWVPTSQIVQQQAPLLPEWGANRTFAMPTGASCPLPPPPEFSETPGSAFHAEAQEVYDTSRTLTDEQRLIARFWSDDPMLSPTPPGHWISIALQIIQRDAIGTLRAADILARLGIGTADAFIGCWHSKFEFDLVRPVTYIRRTIDAKWEPLLITPPFPEYPSGHSTQSGAAAEILTAIFGEDFAFEDATHEDDGLPVRKYPSFHAAAKEAALSRLYGGIHFRAAIERGLEQGRCVGAHVTALKTLA